jgi:citrate synthase
MPDYVPGLAGIPAARSSISFVDGENGILEYRGIRIQSLAAKSSFEEVAYLLLAGKLPTQSQLKAFSEALNAARRMPPELVAVIREFPATAHPMDALQTSVGALGMLNPRPDYSVPEVREKTALQIIAVVPSMVAAFHRLRTGNEPLEPDSSLGHAADFLRMVTGDTPDELTARVMDVALILHADHTMNASTFTARVTASTGASPYSLTASAIGSLSGPLHGGANERVLHMLGEIGSKNRVPEIINGMIDRKEKIMGLGHRVYKTKDPRAIILQELATKVFEAKGKSKIYDIATRLEEVAKERLADKGIYPNVDFYSGIVYDKLGIPTDLFTPVFAVARVSGWLAHWLEQMRDNRIFRPRQIYAGDHDIAYTDITERGDA